MTIKLRPSEFLVIWLEEAILSGLRSVPLVGAFAAAAGSVAEFVTVSYLILVFGDLAPKGVALSALERAALLITSPLRLLIVVVRPFFSVLEHSNRGFGGCRETVPARSSTHTIFAREDVIYGRFRAQCAPRFGSDALTGYSKKDARTFDAVISTNLRGIFLVF